MTTNRITLVLAAGLAGLALITTGCSSESSSESGDAKKSTSSARSGDSGGGSDAAAADRQQKLRACLREKGMEVPDLEPGTDPNTQTLGQPEGVTAEKWQKALQDCGVGMEPGSGDGSEGDSQQGRDQQVKIAECLRDKGFEMPDPKAGTGGAQPALKMPEGADPDKFLKALNECAA